MNPGLVITDLLGRVTAQPGHERRLAALPVVVALWGQDNVRTRSAADQRLAEGGSAVLSI